MTDHTIVEAELEHALEAIDLFGIGVTVADGVARFEDDTAAADVPLVVRASVTPSDATRLVGSTESPVLVVGDLVHEQAKSVLRDGGASYWDRRGDLVLDVPALRLRIRTATADHIAGADGPDPMYPIAGAGGLAVAVATLLSPEEPPGVRDIARRVEMAPSTISRARRHLVDANLLDAEGRPLLPELFWAASDVWDVTWWPVSEEPTSGRWLLAADAAAAEWGAPTLGADRRYYGADPAAVARWRLERPAPADQAACVVAVPPTPIIIDDDGADWVAPVVAALDISRDARGREILGEWTQITGAAEARTVWQ